MIRLKLRDYFIILVSLCFNTSIFSNPIIDSLLNQIELTTNDNDKVKLLIECGKYYSNQYSHNLQKDSAVYFFEKALESPNDHMEEIFLELGLTYRHFRNYDSAMIYFQKGIDMEFENEEKNRSKSQFFFNKGTIYQIILEYEKSQTAYEEALKIFLETKDTAMITSVYVNMSSLFRNDLIKSIAFLEKANDFTSSIEGNNVLKVLVKLSLGGQLIRVGESEKAFWLFESVKKIINNSKEPIDHFLVDVHFRLADLYNSIGEFKKGETEALKAIEKVPKNSSNMLKLTTLISLSNSLFGQKKYKDILSYRQEIVQLLNLLSDQTDERVLKMYEMFAKAAFFSNQLKLGMEYQDSFYKVSNHLLIETKKEVSANMQLKYDLRVKERERLAIKKQKKLSNLLLILGIGVLGIFIFVIYQLKEKGKLLFLLNKQQEEIIESKNTIEIQKDKLIAVNDAKIQFFNNISHEFRTPLTLILNPVRDLYIEAKSLPNGFRRKLEIIENHSQHLLKLVTQILDFSKKEQSELHLLDIEFNLSNTIERIVKNFQSGAIYKEIELTFQSSISTEVYVKTDLMKLEIVLRNLISNAFKFTRPGGRVEVILKIDEENIQLYVKDNGQGILNKDLPHIFDRFYQASSTQNNANAGNGIGLSICKAYTEAMKGTIEVKSEFGSGSIFKITLPKTLIIKKTEVVIDERTAEMITYEFANDQQIDETATKVLIVEDNIGLAMYLKDLLKVDYHPILARNGKEAFNLLTQDNNYELIISDYMMPEMDGLQLLEKIRADKNLAHIPFIILTAKSNYQNKIQALQLGTDDYLTKPFNNAELFARIEYLIERSNARKEYLNLLKINRKDVVITDAENDSEDIASTNSNQKKLSQEDEEWIEELKQIIYPKIGDYNLTISQVAMEIGLSGSQLIRKTKSFIGMTPMQLIQEIRFEEARKLLEERTYSTVKRVAYSIGFKDLKNFSRNYKKRFGKNPKDYYV